MYAHSIFNLYYIYIIYIYKLIHFEFNYIYIYVHEYIIRVDFNNINKSFSIRQCYLSLLAESLPICYGHCWGTNKFNGAV